MSPKTSWWLWIGRRLLPNRVWNGAGVVVDKRYRGPYTGEALVPVGRGGLDYGSGTVAARWILVIKDKRGEEHYVNVGQQVWDQHREGDIITPDDPLVDLP